MKTYPGSSPIVAIFTGTGNNTIVLGPRSVSVLGGVEINAASLSWSEANVTTSNVFNNVDGVSAPYSAPPLYYGSTFADVPVGLGNDTIFCGGNNFINLESVEQCKREVANDMEGRVAA